MWEYKATDYKNDFVRHSGHKYINKFMKAGKWVYEYPITGKGYYDDSSHGKQGEMIKERDTLNKQVTYEKKMQQKEKLNKESSKGGHINYKLSIENKSKAASDINKQLKKDRSNYENKSLFGRAGKIKRKIGKLSNKTLSNVGHLISKGSKRTNKRKKQ